MNLSELVFGGQSSLPYRHQQPTHNSNNKKTQNRILGVKNTIMRQLGKNEAEGMGGVVVDMFPQANSVSETRHSRGMCWSTR